MSDPFTHRRLAQLREYEQMEHGTQVIRGMVRRLERIMARPHVHTPDDGRPRRLVYVDGLRVDRVRFADCRRGFVVQMLHPIQLTADRKRVRCRRLTGHVVVGFA